MGKKHGQLCFWFSVQVLWYIHMVKYICSSTHVDAQTHVHADMCCAHVSIFIHVYAHTFMYRSSHIFVHDIDMCGLIYSYSFSHANGWSHVHVFSCMFPLTPAGRHTCIHCTCWSTSNKLQWALGLSGEHMEWVVPLSRWSLSSRASDRWWQGSRHMQIQ